MPHAIGLVSVFGPAFRATKEGIHRRDREAGNSSFPLAQEGNCVDTRNELEVLVSLGRVADTGVIAGDGLC